MAFAVESTVAQSTPMDVDIPVASVEDGPVPLSFPALLRNPGLSSRYAYLQPNREQLSRSDTAPAITKKVSRRDDNEGKRWLRRKENGALELILLFSSFSTSK